MARHLLIHAFSKTLHPRRIATIVAIDASLLSRPALLAGCHSSSNLLCCRSRCRLLRCTPTSVGMFFPFSFNHRFFQIFPQFCFSSLSINLLCCPCPRFYVLNIGINRFYILISLSLSIIVFSPKPNCYLCVFVIMNMGLTISSKFKIRLLFGINKFYIFL